MATKKILPVPADLVAHAARRFEHREPTELVQVRLPPGHHDVYKKAADKLGITLGDYTVIVICTQLGQPVPERLEPLAPYVEAYLNSLAAKG